MSCILFDFPLSISLEILKHWLTLPEICRLDNAVCNTSTRRVYLEIVSCKEAAFSWSADAESQDEIRRRVPQCIRWLHSRNLSIEGGAQLGYICTDINRTNMVSFVDSVEGEKSDALSSAVGEQSKGPRISPAPGDNLPQHRTTPAAVSATASQKSKTDGYILSKVWEYMSSYFTPKLFGRIEELNLVELEIDQKYMLKVLSCTPKLRVLSIDLSRMKPIFSDSGHDVSELQLKDEAFVHFGEYCPGLQVLDIRDSEDRFRNGDIIGKHLEGLAEQCPNLRALCLDNMHTRSISCENVQGNFSHLRLLRLQGGSVNLMLNIEWLALVLRGTPLLTHLVLQQGIDEDAKYHNEVDDAYQKNTDTHLLRDFVDVIDSNSIHLPHLISFNTSSSKVGSHEIDKLVEKFPRLQHLCLSYCSITARGVQTILLGLGLLVGLDLSGSNIDYTEVLLEIPGPGAGPGAGALAAENATAAIREAGVMGGRREERGFWGYYSYPDSYTNQNMRTLVLVDCMAICDSLLITLLRTCPNLDNICFIGCIGLTPNVLTSIVAMFPHLKKLGLGFSIDMDFLFEDLTGDEETDEEYMGQFRHIEGLIFNLIQSCPNLEALSFQDIFGESDFWHSKFISDLVGVVPVGLKSLWVGEVHRWYPILQLLKHCPNLRELDWLSDEGTVKEDSDYVLAQYPRLKATPAVWPMNYMPECDRGFKRE